jgi:hypothetical protein
MVRAVVTALLCAAAILAADAVFRTSLLLQLRPLIVSPADQAVLDPPVRLRWEGPRHMRVLLALSGEPPRDLGVHESPLEIASDQFPREGGYQIQVQALRFGSWIRATRWFQVRVTAPVNAPPQPEDHKARTWDTQDLLRALDAARSARDKAQSRTKFLNEESATLREQSERLAKQLEALYKSQDDEAERIAELEQRLSQLGEENRALAEENAAIRQRLSSVIPCTVWGYYSFLRLQAVPPIRRVLTVTDTRGQVFRAQGDCELLRRIDVTAASICFCVGSSWGG